MQVSIIDFTKTKSKYGFRVDAEFYKPEYVFTETCLTNIDNDILVNLVHKIDVGHVGSMVKHYCDEGTLLLQTQNIQEFFVDFADCKRIDGDFHQELKKSQIHTGDILIARSGSFGKASIFLGQETINSADIIIIEPNSKAINPYYLVTFLNCALGVNQLFRFASGGLQGHVNLTILENLIVPLLSDNFQKEIARLVNKAANQIAKSKQIYSQAEQLLLDELGLADWQAKHKLSFVKHYSDTKQAERIDAEYFQPKYDEIVKAIKNYKGGWDTLSNLVSVKKCVEVGSGEYQDERIPFIRVSNLSAFELTEEKYISEKLYLELTGHQPKQGEILLSKDATPGIAYHLNDKPQKMIPSGGILRLKLKDSQVNEDYLTLVLNSLIVKEQINRDVGGSVILHWRPDQVKQTILPILSDANQQKIQQKITESFNLRKKSKHLLECAKKAVEMAIEKNEKTAVSWMKQQAEKLKI